VQNQEEYHFSMRRLTPALVAAFALVLCLPFAQAQIHGTPTSVTSIGFGGHYDRAPGIRPSVTSLGPLGYTAGDHVYHPPTCCIQPLFPISSNPQHSGAHHPHRRQFASGGGYYAVPYPVYLEPDDAADQPESLQPEQPVQYSAGPTIFDRRASDESSVAAEAAFEAAYAERMRAAQQAEPAPQPAAAPAEPAPVADQPQTLLIFKDGRQLEVQNYAILGTTLYDMTPGHRSKIALAELDLNATAKENDDRGISFQLPNKSVTN